MIWFALLIPVITAIVLLVLFSHKTTKTEFVIPFLVSLTLIVAFKSISEYNQVSDTEYWTGWGYEARYYEDWNEYIHKTCSRQVCSGSGEKRTCRTKYYDCSYVDYHPEYWEIYESNNQRLYVSRAKFEELAKRWGNRIFVDMRRHYHTNDGDMYVTKWGNQLDTMEVFTTSHTYENRVAATNNVYQFPKVEPEETIRYGLWAYPPIYSDYQQPSLLGSPGQAALKLARLNALLGKKKQVKVFILLYKDKPLEASFYQEWLWKGGNKNELILTIGLDSNNQVQWSRAFSWSDKERAEIKSRDLALEYRNKPIDLNELVDRLYPIVDMHFERKSFSDFNYISVEPTSFCVILTFVITILVNIGVSIFIVKNEFKEKEIK